MIDKHLIYIIIILVLLSLVKMNAQMLYPYRIGNKFGFVNKDLKFEIPCIYDDVASSFGNMIIVTQNGKKGIFDMNLGQLIIPIEYDNLDYFFGELIALQVSLNQ